MAQITFRNKKGKAVGFVDDELGIAELHKPEVLVEEDTKSQEDLETCKEDTEED